MKNIIAATMLLSVIVPTTAQQTDAIANHMPPLKASHEGARQDRVLKPTEIDAERRKMLWKDRTVDKDGYLRVKSSPEYL